MSEQAKAKCIYCGSSGPFDREHVLPRCLGTVKGDVHLPRLQVVQQLSGQGCHFRWVSHWSDRLGMQVRRLPQQRHQSPTSRKPSRCNRSLSLRRCEGQTTAQDDRGRPRDSHRAGPRICPANRDVLLTEHDATGTAEDLGIFFGSLWVLC